MIIVYTGNGKGKTSACIGQAMRALGRDFAVGFGQFMNCLLYTSPSPRDA